jgi:hypothetical protein
MKKGAKFCLRYMCAKPKRRSWLLPDYNEKGVGKAPLEPPWLSILNDLACAAKVTETSGWLCQAHHCAFYVQRCDLFHSNFQLFIAMPAISGGLARRIRLGKGEPRGSFVFCSKEDVCERISNGTNISFRSPPANWISAALTPFLSFCLYYWIGTFRHGRFQKKNQGKPFTQRKFERIWS